MEILITLVKVIHIIVSILLIITVLLQPGKGGDLGSVFGGGASESIFGSSGAVPFLTKMTRVLAVLFLGTSLGLGYFSAQGISSSVVDDMDIPPLTEPLASPDGESPAPETSPAEAAPAEPGASTEGQSEGGTSESGFEENAPASPQPEGGNAQ